MFSDSALFLMSHLRTVSQSTGRCASLWQFQQNAFPRSQCTSTGTPSPSRSLITARSHPGPVHHFTLGLSSTHDLHWNVESFSAHSSDINRRAIASGTRVEHPASGQRKFRHDGPSPTALSR